MTVVYWHGVVLLQETVVTIARRSYNDPNRKTLPSCPHCAWQFKTVAQYRQASLAHLWRWEVSAPDGTAVTLVALISHTP